ncbi:hypothetical protein [Streptomyces corynorhini]|uniref:Uncharacterized protein n=1 Tax=Streptomyces corynorhini TaxID=2282652 RepID=A0A370BEJ5_9ACTN|nr:hypothetical protein [Streptomyces corynorhini]RDG40120.1 hypothetical protein DVH02_00210 [Streptomyces corynorhini]
MISEPEPVGWPDDGDAERSALPAPRTESGTPPPYDGEGPGSGGETIGAGAPPAGPARRRPWLWALGGAVAASAVWAGGLYAYARTGPDLGGYAISRDLCLDAELPALTERFGRRGDAGSGVDERPSVDRAVCRITLMPAEEREAGQEPVPSTYATVEVGYTLHKKTDPAPEFDARITDLVPADGARPEVRRVPGPGERAYLIIDSGLDGVRLKVLDGRAEFTLEVSTLRLNVVDPTSGESRETEPLDPAGMAPDLVTDMAELMAAVKG